MTTADDLLLRAYELLDRRGQVENFDKRQQLLFDIMNYLDAPKDKTQDEYDLVKVLNDPEGYYPGNFETAEKAAAFLMCLCQEAADRIQRLEAKDEPVAWMFQHEDTGLIDYVDTQQVEWGFEKNNPRWQKIGPVFLHPPAPMKPMTEEEIPYKGSHDYSAFLLGIRFAERHRGIGGDND